MADEKRIIIDEDWKAQVAAEKAEQNKASEASTATQPGPADSAEFEMPPASWELFLTQLATEAMIGLGLIPHPATGQLAPHRGQAKYLIDTIEMLREKAKGNLSPTESQLTDSLLHQLRMAYISLDPAAGAETLQSPG